MIKQKGILQTELFYLQHLNTDSVADREAIDQFGIADEHGIGLEVYLKEYASADEDNREMRTYLVRTNDTDECVGYFSLKAGLISLHEAEEEVLNQDGLEEIRIEFDTLPGVELANFAVNSCFIEAHPYLKGIGHVLFTEFIIPIINEAAKYIGIKMVYIFALPYERLINRYKTYGFQRLSPDAEKDLHKRLKPRYDEDCKFMYQLL